MNPEASFYEATDLGGRLIRATNLALDYWWVWPLVLVALWLFWQLRGQHALLARLDERADAAQGDIDALLIERQALIGNLVEIVRAFAAREQETIRDVLQGRVDAIEALGANGLRIESQMAGVLQNLVSVSENYPKLASESHYQSLRTDLVRIEDRITAARKFYNLAVEELNAVRRSFPGNLLMSGSAPMREKITLGERRADLAEPVRIGL